MVAFRKVELNWKAKALAFNMFERLPFGQDLYFLVQRYVTHTVPRTLAPTAECALNQLAHAKKVIETFHDPSSLRLLEIGAGWDLYSNLVMYCMGINRQIVVDVRRWARPSIVNATIDYLRQDPPPSAVRTPEHRLSAERFDADLEAAYGIKYVAPQDARALPLESHSVDAVITTSTLEHIPSDILSAILLECRRVMRPEGLMSHIIDYSDHYSHSDPAIGNYNYLQFSEADWKRYNPSIHFQNRLRQPDYLDMFNALSLEIVGFTSWEDDAFDEEYRSMALADQFKSYKFDDLKKLGGHFLLRKVGSCRESPASRQ